MAMNFVARVIVMALVSIASSLGKPPVEKVCCLREKTRHSSSCRGRIIALNAEMARVAEVERGNFVCEFHYMQLRKRNNMCSCPLPSHSSTLSKTSIPTRLYKVFDEAGRSIESYRPGTRWCTSCRRSADKTFATQTTYQKPVRRRTVNSDIQQLSSRQSFRTAPYFIMHTVLSSIARLTSNSRAAWVRV